jgi:hypothetical protein
LARTGFTMMKSTWDFSCEPKVPSGKEKSILNKSCSRLVPWSNANEWAQMAL